MHWKVVMALRVKALIDFFDIEKQISRKKDAEFDVAENRAEKLIFLKFVTKVKQDKKEKQITP